MSTGKYSANKLDARPKKNSYYLKDGSNIYRILPPFGSVASVGAIAKFWSIYWVPATKGKRPVPSLLRVGKDKAVIQACPLDEKVKELRRTLEAGIAAGKSDLELNPLRNKIEAYRVNKSFWLNVITTTGEIGRLGIPYNVYQTLKAKLKELEKQGFDPINAGPENGLFLDFKKSKDDSGRKNVYAVDVHTHFSKDPQTGRMVGSYVSAPIDEKILERMNNEAYDLGTMFKELTMEEQKAVATLDPTMVDRIFARGEEVTAGEEGSEDGGEEESVAAQTQREVAAMATTVTPTLATQATRPVPEASAQQAPAFTTQKPPTTAANNDLIKNFLTKGTV